MVLDIRRELFHFPGVEGECVLRLPGGVQEEVVGDQNVEVTVENDEGSEVSDSDSDVSLVWERSDFLS